MTHNELSSTYQSEFESRNNGQKINNPAMDWQQVTMEVKALDNRTGANGYLTYMQQRIYEQATHEQAMAYVIKHNS